MLKSLPDSVVTARNVQIFELRVDKHSDVAVSSIYSIDIDYTYTSNDGVRKRVILDD